MFEWVQPEKRRFFFILMFVVVAEIVLVVYIASIEHKRLEEFNQRLLHRAIES